MLRPDTNWPLIAREQRQGLIAPLGEIWGNIVKAELTSWPASGHDRRLFEYWRDDFAAPYPTTRLKRRAGLRSGLQSIRMDLRANSVRVHADIANCRLGPGVGHFTRDGILGEKYRSRK